MGSFSKSTIKCCLAVKCTLYISYDYFPDALHVSKISNHPPHILNKNNQTLSPSSFIPFCSFAGNWNATGVSTDMFSLPVCNIFNEVLLDGQVCYQADLTKDKIRDMVDKRKIATDGFVMLLDYNENRMVGSGVDMDSGEDSTPLGKREIDKDVMLYIETVGKNYNI